ncbi:MAG: nucleotidyltransferase family protein [Chitinophagaceae bacterium]
MIKEAIILAGGLGTRLREAVPDLPKCMAPVLAKPFIGYLIDYLLQQGIEKFIFSLGYKSNIIKQYLQTQYADYAITYSIEEEPIGTGGAVRLACKKASEKTVLVLNGDTFFKVDLQKLASFHDLCGAHCTLSLKPMRNFSRYGLVELNIDYSIKSFKENQYYEEGLINGGVYALHAEKFLQEELPDKFSFEKNYLEKFAGSRRFYGIIQDDYFIDIGIPEDFERAQTELIINISTNA